MIVNTEYEIIWQELVLSNIQNTVPKCLWRDWGKAQKPVRKISILVKVQATTS